MRSLWIGVVLAGLAGGGGCGSRAARPALPAPAPGDVLGLGELELVDVNTRAVVRVLRDGTVEIQREPGKSFRVTVEGKALLPSGDLVLSLDADGTVRRPDGEPLGVRIAPDGTATTREGQQVAIDSHGNLRGGPLGARHVRVEGAATPGQRRTAMFAMVVLTAPAKSEPLEPPPPSVPVPTR